MKTGQAHGIFPLIFLLFSAELCATEALPAKTSSVEHRRAGSGKQPEESVSVLLRAIYEAKQLRNSKLRYGEDRSNKIETEPTLRLNMRGFKGQPVSFFSEIEFIRKKKRQTAARTTTTDTLNVNQAWLQFKDSLIANGDLRVGRWLIRDEREWLFDENIDGVYARFGDRLTTEIGAGQVNYWQRNLLESSTRGDKTHLMTLISRYEIEDRWRVGAYAVWQYNSSTESNRQLNLGLRSFSRPRQMLSHWLDIATVRGQKGDEALRGYAVDGGAMFRLESVPLQPHFMLGYAWGSGDDNSNDGVAKRFRQTGLQGNETSLGSVTKYKLYGDTLDPELTNMHIFTAGAGINLDRDFSLDFIWHYYRQDRLAALVKNSTDLDAKYDRLTTKKLGAALDILVGWRPAQHVKLEASAAWFAPSSRFYTGSSRDSVRASSASSWWLKAEVKF